MLPPLAMPRDHALLLELIEHGFGLTLSPDIKRVMLNLSESATSALPTLSAMENSRNLALVPVTTLQGQAS
ncbi:MAG: hypothetical protein M0P39_14555 [Rhodocyclaceae bacterium]|jgi:hypothetical protein|nr:hypothetical protein [Rhodocyclaceae bacterium]